MINIEEMIGKTYYRPIPKTDHKNDTKAFVPEEVILTKKSNTFYWGNEQCHPSWLNEKALLYFETKEECQIQCNQFNYEKGYIKIDANNVHLYYKFMSKEAVAKLPFKIQITTTCNIAIRNDDCNEYEDEGIAETRKLRYAVEYCYSPSGKIDDIEEYCLDFEYFDTEEEADDFIKNTVLIPENKF